MDSGLVPCRETDVVVVGGGPAGTATAITAVSAGLSAVLVERTRFPRHRPGEALHPGTQLVFEQLGVAAEVDSAAAFRHQGVVSAWGNAPAYRAFGNDNGVPWRGYLVDRAVLDGILLARARSVGVTVLQPCTVREVSGSDELRWTVSTSEGEITSKAIVDATGGFAFSRRYRWVYQFRVSPVLHAHYGYLEVDPGRPFRDPRIEANATGWSWTSRIAADRLHWMRLSYPTAAGECSAKAARRSAPVWEQPTGAAVGPIRGADVSWAINWPPSDSQWFAVGDAATTVDPVSSQGNLRALMTGVAAAHLLRGISDPASSSQATRIYNDWIRSWFFRDCENLLALYRQSGATWADNSSDRLVDLKVRLADRQLSRD